MKYFSSLLLLFCIICLPVVPEAKDLEPKAVLTTPVAITAVTLEYNKEENTYTGKGAVEVREGTRILTADYVFYNDTTKDMLAEGKVTFQDEDDRVSAERMQLNLATRKGTIEKGEIFLKKGNFYITGEKIDKVGDKTYHVRAGGLTTCDGSPPAWKFVASDVKVTVEGYATTSSARFKILDQTVLYLPWGMFPVKTERQSGLLIPELATSTRDGFVVKTSYFWAISKDKDATFYLDYIEQRGIKPGVEFRYALTEETKGSWYSSMVDDNKYDHTRYQIKGKHEQVLMKDGNFRLNMNHVSDIDYLKDFGTTTVERSENLIKSNAFFEKPLPRSMVTVEMAHFRNLTQKDNDPTFQYLPFVSYFTESIPLVRDRLYADFTGNLTNFYREKGETYTRMVFEPRMRLPFSFQGVNFLLNGTGIERTYMIDREQGGGSRTRNQETFKVEGDANIQLIRHYHTSLFDLGEMQSLIKPQLKYTYIPKTSFTDIPSIDPSDRIREAHAVTYSFNHYLNSMSESGVREISLLEVSQSYGLSGSLYPSDFYKGSGSRFSDIDAKLTITPTEKIALSTESQISTSGQGLTGTKNTFTYSDPARYYANITQSYTRDLVNEVLLDLGGRYWLLEGKYQIRYSFRDTMWIDTLYQLTYRPQCWAVTLRLTQSRRPRDTSINLSVDLAGITGR